MQRFKSLVSLTIAASVLSLLPTVSGAIPQRGIDFGVRTESSSSATPRRAVVPARCRVTLQSASGERAAYSSACLQQNFSQSGSLPGSCETSLDTADGRQGFFDATCLRDAGWRTR